MKTPLNRRTMLLSTSGLLGTTALTWLMRGKSFWDEPPAPFSKKVEHVIYIHHIGAPSQLDTFDYKPALTKLHGTELPSSVRNGQRLTSFTNDQSELLIAQSKFGFAQHGQSGIWLSDLLPQHRDIVDDICVIRSVHTEAINHVPAATFVQTGDERAGRPSLGAWVNHGLGSENENLPGYVVMSSVGKSWTGGEAIQSQLWNNGFLPSTHQGVKFQKAGDPIPHLSNPRGTDPNQRLWLDALAAQNRATSAQYGDPEIESRIAQFELAYRMQTAVPELTDMSDEDLGTIISYGNQATRPGSFANNCLMARRMVERGVRFVQLFHRGWDHHEEINRLLPPQCREADQAAAAMLLDLKQRRLLDKTLVIWGSEFGRTVYTEGALNDPKYGRDHHPRCFSVWMAGGPVKRGYVHGETDELGYNVARDPVHVHDLNATILHCLGLDHKKLSFQHRGRDFRLTDVGGNVVHDILRA